MNEIQVRYRPGHDDYRVTIGSESAIGKSFWEAVGNLVASNPATFAVSFVIHNTRPGTEIFENDFIRQTKTQETVEIKASDLRTGDLVDLEHGEFFHNADGSPDLTMSEYGVVGEIVHETPDCLVIEFENIGTAGYSPDHVFKVKRGNHAQEA